MIKSEDKEKITLFVPYYTCESETRQAELDLCLRQNIDNATIERIILIIDDGSIPPLQHDKIKAVNVEGRPTYRLWLDLTKDYVSNGISVLANSDLYFDHTIPLLSQVLKSKDTFVALSRYESNGDEWNLHQNPHWSQDSWAIRSGVSVSEVLHRSLEIPMGVPRCDNRVAYLFVLYGWKVVNPCRFIRSYHQHQSLERKYDLKVDRSVMGTVAYLNPVSALDEGSDVWIDIWVERDEWIRNITLNKFFSNARRSETDESQWWDRHNGTLLWSCGRFIKALSHSRNLYVWGAGALGSGWLRLMAKEGLSIYGVIDSDRDKRGTFCEGVPVISPSVLTDTPVGGLKPFVLIASMYSNEIITDLKAMGLQVEKDFIVL
jgi:hypothetical protein